MKSPMLAFTLNFFLPGAGLCYLGKWVWGIANFLAVLGIGFIMVFLFKGSAQQHMSGLTYGIAGGSGGLALALANMRNAKLAESAGNTRRRVL